MSRLLVLVLGATFAFSANAATTTRVPDIALFDASETLVAIGANGAPDGGSTLSVYDAAIGAGLSTTHFDSRTHGLFFCGSKEMLAWTEKAVLRIDPRSGTEETIMPLAPGERIAVAPRCDSVAIYGAERRDVTVHFLASRRKITFELPGTRAACYAGDESAVMALTTSGEMFEGELQKKRRRIPLPATATGDAFGIACFGKHGLAIGGREAEIRSAAAASGKRVPLACSLEYHRCSMSADGRTLGTTSDETGKVLKAIRFHSTSRLKGLDSVPLADFPVSIAVSPSGASAVATFAQGSAVLVSRANGSHLKLAAPGARIPQ
jgi:hypothetical protein